MTVKSNLVPATPPTNAVSDRYREALDVLQTAISDRAFPGCAFGMLVDSQVVAEGALGSFTYDNDSLPVQPTTLFDVASLTKVLSTTAAAMLLYHRGLLDLDLPVAELLPGFIIGRDDSRLARRVTIRHLLAHSSGLPGYVPLFRTASTPTELMRALLALPIEAEPGTRAEYSDPGFMLLGKALEALTGTDLASWTRREIFDPVGMTSTRFCPAPSLRPQIPPTEIDELFRMRRIQGEVQDEHASLLRGVAGHAGLFSNVPEILRFAETILKPNSQIGPILFQARTVQLFAERQPPGGSSRALGWDTPSGDSSSGNAFSAHSIGHLGYSGCSLWIDLEANVAIVLLTNRTWPDRQARQIQQVRPALHDALRKAL